jgi:5'-nucleotidase / UDP-sugar diphosphatase
MRRTALFTLFFFLTLWLTATAQDKSLVILHTNDLHSRLRGYAPELQYTSLTTGDDSTIGGFSRIATVISRERERSGDNLLVLDAGDFLMGTLFDHLEKRDGFQLRLMADMGYDVLTVGNHEFDEGPATFAEIVRVAASHGEIPSLVLSNVRFARGENEGNEVEKLFEEELLKEYIIVDNPSTGLKIGIFGLLGEDAADVAPAAAPLRFGQEVRTARRIVRELRNQNCDIIICLSHSGFYRNSDGTYSGEDIKLAEKVKGIDLIISGHSHTRVTEPLTIGETVVVQTGAYGSSVGRVEFRIDGQTPRFHSFNLIPVNDEIPGDRKVTVLIEERIAMVDRELLSDLGLSYREPLFEVPFLLHCNEEQGITNSNLGQLVAHAIHNYVNDYTPEGTDISLVARGVIRADIVPGIQSVPDIFRVMSLGSGYDGIPGYPLSRVYVTGRELKSITEILLTAWKSSPSNYIYYSGLEIWHDPDAGMLRKVDSLIITSNSGTRIPVDLSRGNPQLYSITANSYILEFVGIIKK